MKKFAAIIMLLGAMLLCGCGADEDSETEETTAQEKVTTQYDI